MKLSEIIKSACLNSQVVPSTNLADIPGDIYDIALHKLKYDVLGTLNVDRTLDMAVFNRVFQPKANSIELKLDPAEVPAITSDQFVNRTPNNYNVVGSFKGWNLLTIDLSDLQMQELKSSNRWSYVDLYAQPTTTKRVLLNKLRTIFVPDVYGYLFNQTEVIAIDNFTNSTVTKFINISRPPLAFITQDGYLWLCIPQITPQNNLQCYLWRTGTNMRWMPYFIDTIVDFPSGLPHTLLSKSQWDSIDFKFIPWVYSVENGDDWLRIDFKSTGNVPKNVTMPKPIYIEGDNLVAPPKFHQYIVDCVAEQLALLYNMSSIAQIQEQKAQAYGVLKRQNPNPVQPINVRLTIRNTLQSGQSRWFRFDGFNGG